MSRSAFSSLLEEGERRLRDGDPALYELLDRETTRQRDVLAMVAASSIADASVLVCEGAATTNVTAEGYPGRRYHAGCEIVDDIERLAVARAREAFQADYANVQPHSGSSANCIVMFSFLNPGDVILGMDLDAGGHLTHGASASVSGQYFRGVGYGLDQKGHIDFDQVANLADEHRPKLIICGASAYPRVIDFSRFREIADRIGALVLADISHIAGLVAGRQHPSPIHYAHFTTTSTYKQLNGPRGGLILMGRDHAQASPDGAGTLADKVQRAVFPYFQGTPNLSSVAAKARALELVRTEGFLKLAERIVASARALASSLAARGFDLVTGGTDNHIVLLNVLSSHGLTGAVAEKALEECAVVVNKNKIPADRTPASVTSGLRIGTNSLAIRGLGPEEMDQCAEIINEVLCAVEPNDDRGYTLSPDIVTAMKRRVSTLCEAFPIPGYPGGLGS